MYVCEGCGQIFVDPDMCQQHEEYKHHMQRSKYHMVLKKPPDPFSVIYTENIQPDGFPEEIKIVKQEDNDILTYRRKEPCKPKIFYLT